MIRVLKEIHYSLISVKKCSRSVHSISICPDKQYTKPIEKLNFQKQTFDQAIKGNQNLSNKQVASNKKTGKLLALPYRSRFNSCENRDTSRHRSSTKQSYTNS